MNLDELIFHPTAAPVNTPKKTQVFAPLEVVADDDGFCSTCGNAGPPLPDGMCSICSLPWNDQTDLETSLDLLSQAQSYLDEILKTHKFTKRMSRIQETSMRELLIKIDAFLEEYVNER